MILKDAASELMDHWVHFQTVIILSTIIGGLARPTQTLISWSLVVVWVGIQVELLKPIRKLSCSIPGPMRRALYRIFRFQVRNYWSFLLHCNLNLITFKGSEFLYYAPIYHENAFFIFGGKHWPDFFTKIARIDVETRLWSIVGDLRNPRMSHGVILIGNSFMVVGGYANIKSEKCTLENNRMNCVELASGLPGYVNHPYFAPVHSNFAEYCN